MVLVVAQAVQAARALVVVLVQERAQAQGLVEPAQVAAPPERAAREFPGPAQSAPVYPALAQVVVSAEQEQEQAQASEREFLALQPATTLRTAFMGLAPAESAMVPAA